MVIDSTGLSRRKAFAAIREGRVRVGGQVSTEPSAPYGDGEVSLDGEPIAATTTPKTYLLLNKPRDFVTTVSDELGRWTVLDLVPEELRVPGLHPVGRLDRNTSGLLILTNDGDLTHRLTHPRHEVDKEYWVGFERPPEPSLLDRLRQGVEIDGAIRKPLDVHPLTDEGGFSVSITIGEGRKRQVRRMFEALGLQVWRLRRVREGPLQLGKLPEGKTRRLAASEVAALKGETTGRRA
jgi:23S rRNA pseudouridine2605 synthase